jgi:hypothetical protein
MSIDPADAPYRSAVVLDGATGLYYTIGGGVAGTVLLNGAGAPTDGLGDVGNYYLDAVGHVLYGPKAATAPIWPIALPANPTIIRSDTAPDDLTAVWIDTSN